VGLAKVATPPARVTVPRVELPFMIVTVPVGVPAEDDTVAVNRVDVSEHIRSPEVNACVSTVAAVPAVRSAMVSLQRLWMEDHAAGVVEGRDIGTVVFPDASLKIFLTASKDARTARRSEEGAGSVSNRDEIDSTRRTAPLARSKDAIVVDTTDRPEEEIVEEVLAWL